MVEKIHEMLNNEESLEQKLNSNITTEQKSRELDDNFEKERNANKEPVTDKDKDLQYIKNLTSQLQIEIPKWKEWAFDIAYQFSELNLYNTEINKKLNKTNSQIQENLKTIDILDLELRGKTQYQPPTTRLPIDIIKQDKKTSDYKKGLEYLIDFKTDLLAAYSREMVDIQTFQEKLTYEIKEKRTYEEQMRNENNPAQRKKIDAIRRDIDRMEKDLVYKTEMLHEYVSEAKNLERELRFHQNAYNSKKDEKIDFREETSKLKDIVKTIQLYQEDVNEYTSLGKIRKTKEKTVKIGFELLPGLEIQQEKYKQDREQSSEQKLPDEFYGPEINESKRNLNLQNSVDFFIKKYT